MFGKNKKFEFVSHFVRDFFWLIDAQKVEPFHIGDFDVLFFAELGQLLIQSFSIDLIQGSIIWQIYQLLDNFCS